MVGVLRALGADGSEQQSHAVGEMSGLEGDKEGEDGVGGGRAGGGAARARVGDETK